MTNKTITFGFFVQLNAVLLIGCHSSETAPPTNPQEVIRRFCQTIREAKNYRVTIGKTIVVDPSPKNFKVEMEYDLAISRPNRARLWVNRGVNGPTVICDGSRLLYSTLPHRKAEVVTSAPATLTEIATDTTLGPKFSLRLRQSDYIWCGLLEGDPKDILDRRLGAAKYMGQEKVSGTVCFHLRSENENEDIDAWFESEGRNLLRRVFIVPKGKGKGFNLTQSFDKWLVNQNIPDSFFTVIDPADGKAPKQKTTD